MGTFQPMGVYPTGIIIAQTGLYLSRQCHKYKGGGACPHPPVEYPEEKPTEILIILWVKNL